MFKELQEALKDARRQQFTDQGREEILKTWGPSQPSIYRAVVHKSKYRSNHLMVEHEDNSGRTAGAHIRVHPWEKHRSNNFYGSVRATSVTWGRYI